MVSAPVLITSNELGKVETKLYFRLEKISCFFKRVNEKKY